MRSGKVGALLIGLVTLGALLILSGDLPGSKNVLPRKNPPPLAGSAVHPITGTASQKLIEAYGKLPLGFEPCVEASCGGDGSPARFVSRGPGYTLFLTPTEAVLALRKPQKSEARSQESEVRSQKESAGSSLVTRHSSLLPAVLRMKLAGANPAPQITGLDPLPGKSNYFIGNDPTKWRTNVPTYPKVKYEAVYPGIDLVFYGNQQQLEYDFEVAAGADPNAIRLSFEGAEKLQLDAGGDLVISTASEEIRLRRPVTYQESHGLRQEVSSSYLLEASNQVFLAIGEYDVERPLVIDPMLVFSTALVGANARAMVLDDAGNAYLTGDANGVGFPVTLGAFGTTGRGIFVAKVNLAGPTLIYSTYVSSPPFFGFSAGSGIAVDSFGNAYVAGVASQGFPTTAGAFQAVIPSTAAAAIVLKLNPEGSRLLYATYLGSESSAQGIAVDSAGNAYVAGYTTSPTFPAFGPIQSTFGGGTCANSRPCSDAFVTKLNPDGSGLLYSTFLGGPAADAAYGIALDSSGNAYVTGAAGPNFPTTPGAFQSRLQNGGAFISKLDTRGTTLVYSTYLGGNASGTIGTVIALDAARNTYITGLTTASDFPIRNGFQATLRGQDAFVVKLDPTGSFLVYSTLYGGSGSEYASTIALDGDGNAYIAGATTGCDLPVVDPLLREGTSTDLSVGYTCRSGISILSPFVAKFSALGNSLLFSTFLPGYLRPEAFLNWANAVAVDGAGDIYVAGYIQLSSFPAIPSLLGTPRSFVGGLLAKITLSANPSPQVASISPASAISPTSGFNLTVTGAGFFAGSVVLWNGAPRPTTVQGLTRLVASISAQDISGGGTAEVSVFNPPPGGGISNARAFTLTSIPGPAILGLQPPSVVAGGPAFTLTVSGTSFLRGAVVRWNGSDRATNYVNSTLLTVFVPPGDLAASGTVAITVANPPPSGGLSTSFPWTIYPPGSNPSPIVSSLSPSTGKTGEAGFLLTVFGSSFVSGAIVQWNGNTRTTTFINGNQLSAAIPASDIATEGIAEVTVANPLPGGGPSNARTVAVTAAGVNPLPLLHSISPALTQAGGVDFTMTINGSNFVSGAVVQMNGGNLPTIRISANQLLAAISADFIGQTRTAQITVANPAPGGGTSSPITFAINPPGSDPPLLRSLSPASALPGGPDFTLTVNGSNFFPGAVVQWNGSNRTTTFVSSNQLTALIRSSDIARAGTAQVTVLNSSPVFATSNALTFTIGSPGPNLQPVIQSLSPASTLAGSGAFTLTVTGSNFVSGAVVQWNGISRATTFVSGSQLAASIPAADVANTGTAQVTVINPGSGVSNRLTFSILPVPQGGAVLTANLTIWRPSEGTWYVLPASNADPNSPITRQWGGSGDIPVPADYDGDGRLDFAVWRPSDGTWYILRSTNPNPNAALITQWGTGGDIPMPADYDGDGRADFAVWRPSDGTWYILRSTNPDRNAPLMIQWGASGDIPVPGDYDGDGRPDLAVWRPSDGTWYILRSSNLDRNAPLRVQWGASGDVPVPGDYDGDGRADTAVWRPSDGIWYILRSSNPDRNAPLTRQWGTGGDNTVPGDYDGDGRTDIVIWRPSDGVWYLIPSRTPNNSVARQWGALDDVPLYTSNKLP